MNKTDTVNRCGGSRTLGKTLRRNKRSRNKKKELKMTVSARKGGSRMHAARHENKKVINFDQSKSGRRK